MLRRNVIRFNDTSKPTTKTSYIQLLRQLVQWNKSNAAAGAAAAPSTAPPETTTASSFAFPRLAMTGGAPKNHYEAMTDIVQARYTCKSFHPTKKVDPALVKEMLDTTRRSPTGFNLQGWKAVVVDQEELKWLMCKACLGQQQVLQCSQCVVFLGDKECERNAPAALELGLKEETVRANPPPDASTKKASYYGPLYGATYLRQVYYYLHTGPLNSMQFLKYFASYWYTQSSTVGSSSPPPTAPTAATRLPASYVPLLTVPKTSTGYAYKQTIFAVMTFVYLCTSQQIQSNIMEGFDEEAVKRVVGLHLREGEDLLDRYTVPCVVCIGYAPEGEEEPLGTPPSSLRRRVRSPRFALSHFMSWNKF